MAKTACVFCKKVHDFDVDEAFQMLRRTPDTLRELLDGIDVGVLSKKRNPAEWSPRQLLVHFIDVEILYGYRFRLIMAEKEPVITPVDQDHWSETFTYGMQDGTQLIRAFTPLRRVNLEMLQTVDRKLFEKPAKHPEYGSINVGMMIPHLAAHDTNHLQQLRDRILAV